MAYLPQAPADREAMLAGLGITGIDALFADIPSQARLTHPLNLPPGLGEAELAAVMANKARENRSLDDLVSFLGFGYYDRYVPYAVDALANRGEFATAYTPYQAELSQGTLAAIFEYQTMVASLTGMDAAQASLYDGASAAAEAGLLAMAHTGRRTVALARTLHPDVRQVVTTYVRGHGGAVVTLNHPRREGLNKAAALIWPYPDVMGSVDELPSAIETAHAEGALAVSYCDPVALALLTPPGTLGADLAVGEGQALGNPLHYGGPGLGFFAAKSKFIRRMPGRLVGVAYDERGHRGLVLTLQAREQHIRREKAVSNVCSNHSLNALRAAIYLSLVGPRGLREIAQLSVQKAHYLRSQLLAIGGIAPARPGPVLYEFALQVPGVVADLNRWLFERGILGGADLGRWDSDWAGCWQLAVTERRTREEIDRLVEEVRAWISR